MEQTIASKLIEQNLHTIFAWSLSKLYDKNEAEDLAHDIICAVLKSVHRLENDDAFWGFVWRIAENTLHATLRKKSPDTIEATEGICGTYWITPEDEFLKSDEIRLLRRELSLLSKQYREVTVKHYIYGKTCSEISSEQNMSEEMVKYYLFKTRKILKEGIGMIREYGEKSYNPQTFRMDFWGDEGNIYWKLFERKLPGNILLSAYDKPVTTTELSIELGVSTVYLEDELEILTKHELLKKVGDKYQTNIIIFTDVYEKKSLEAFKPIYEKAASTIATHLEEAFPSFKQLDFYGKDFDENRLKWTMTNLAMYHALCEADEIHRAKFGEYPLLSNGSYGFIFGYDNDYENHHFNGIYGNLENVERTARISIENYRIIENCQNIQPHNMDAFIHALTSATLLEKAEENNEELIRLIHEGIISSNDGILSPNFPVFTLAVFEETKQLLAPIVKETCECISQICTFAEKLLTAYVPGALKKGCGQVATIHHQIEPMALIMETLVATGQLSIPKGKTNLCIFGVQTK